MIWQLLRFDLKKALSALLTAVALAVCSVLGALRLFRPDMLEPLSAARSQAEPLFRAFGIGSSASLTLHLVSLALAFLLPLIGVVLAVSAATALMAGMIESGEMAHFLAAPRTRGAIMRTQAFALLVMMAVLAAATLGAAALGGLAMYPGELSVPGMAAAAAGLLALWVAAAWFALMVACGQDTLRGARRKAGMWVFAGFLLWMLSRSDALLSYLMYATPFTLYAPEKLSLLRQDAWPGVAGLAGLAIACLGLGLYRFCRRDLPL